MAYDCTVTQQLLRRQQDMFREAANIGITHKALRHRTGLSLSIIGQYARGETALSMPSMLKMQPVLGEALISLLFPDNLQIIDAPSAMDHDAVVMAAHDYITANSAARCEDSECGPAIGPNEDKHLRGKGAKLAAVAS